jgi:hypothetical protein
MTVPYCAVQDGRLPADAEERALTAKLDKMRLFWTIITDQ